MPVSLPQPFHGLFYSCNRNDFHARYFLFWRIGFGNDRLREAELGGFFEAFLSALHRAHFSGQAYFTEHDELFRQWFIFERRHNGEQHREVGARLGNFHAAYRIDENILIETGDARVAAKSKVFLPNIR